MPANIGTADRVIRIGLGLTLVVAAFIPALPLAASPLLQWGAAVVGAVLVATALVRLCPIYMLFGLSTCKVSSR